MHGDAPKYMSDLVCLYKPARALRSANNRACKFRARKRGLGQLGAGGPYTPC